MSEPAVLLITLRSDTGGGPKHVYDLASSLLERKIKVFIASPDDEPFGRHFSSEFDGFFYLPTRTFSLASFLGLLDYCFSQNIQVIHSHGRGAGIYSRLLKLFGFHIVHTYHGIHVEPTLNGKIKVLVDKILSPLTDSSIFVSDDEKKMAEDIGLTRHSQSYVIYNGIKISPFIFHDQSRGIIGTLARLTYQKGIDSLLTFFSNFTKTEEGKGVQLHIAGKGEQLEYIRKLISEKKLENQVKLVGETHQPLLFLKTLDVYVSTARWEGLPLSVLEAMNSGVPCVLSPVPGHMRFISSGVALSASTEAEFTQQLQGLFKNTKLKKQIAEKAHDFIEREHSLNKQVSLTLDAYGINL